MKNILIVCLILATIVVTAPTKSRNHSTGQPRTLDQAAQANAAPAYGDDKPQGKKADPSQPPVKNLEETPLVQAIVIGVCRFIIPGLLIGLFSLQYYRQNLALIGFVWGHLCIMELNAIVMDLNDIDNYQDILINMKAYIWFIGSLVVGGGVAIAVLFFLKSRVMYASVFMLFWMCWAVFFGFLIKSFEVGVHHSFLNYSVQFIGCIICGFFGCSQAIDRVYLPVIMCSSVWGGYQVAHGIMMIWGFPVVLDNANPEKLRWVKDWNGQQYLFFCVFGMIFSSQMYFYQWRYYTTGNHHRLMGMMTDYENDAKLLGLDANCDKGLDQPKLEAQELEVDTGIDPVVGTIDKEVKLDGNVQGGTDMEGNVRAETGQEADANVEAGGDLEVKVGNE